MNWFGKKRGAGEPDDQQAQSEQAVREMLDPHHPRASIIDGDRVLLQPAQVLDNITLAMERLDNDIDTPISIEEDVVPLDELLAMVQSLRMDLSSRLTWSTPECGSCQRATRWISYGYPCRRSTTCGRCTRCSTAIRSTRPQRRSSTSGLPATPTSRQMISVR